MGTGIQAFAVTQIDERPGRSLVCTTVQANAHEHVHTGALYFFNQAHFSGVSLLPKPRARAPLFYVYS